VKKKGIDIDERDTTNNKTAFQLAQELGMKEVMQKIQWLQKWAKVNKKKIKALQRKKEKAVIRIQTIVRGFIAPQKIKEMRELQSFGVWSNVALAVSRLELGVEDRPHYFGKSWIQLKVETDLVVHEQLDLLDSSSLASDDDNSWSEDLDNYFDESQETTRADPATSKGIEPNAEGVNSIQLTTDALKWLRTVKDEKYRQMFAKRLGQLAQGDRSYCLRKTLKGSSRVVTETKLDSGQRIIWTQRGNDIMIWFICKHKHINRCLNLVDISYERVISSNMGKQELGGQDVAGIVARVEVGHTGSQAGATPSVSTTDPVEPEILVNPTANVPLKIHSIYISELDRLVSDNNWTPPFKLTSQEEDIVNREGTVLLLGRAGKWCIWLQMRALERM
jgi:putative component of toxin-antitoxin plasmid stabilization module